MKDNPLVGFAVDPASITFVGDGLVRPECVIAERSGVLWSCDARGGIARIDGAGTTLLQLYEANPENVGLGDGDLVNGMALMGDGSFYIANLGGRSIDQAKDGSIATRVSEVGGRRLGAMNFVLRDSRDRIWFTVMTSGDLLTSINGKADDGYIGVIDEHGTRIVADGLAGANEIRFDADEHHLYVVESFRQCVTRFRVEHGGRLSGRERYGPTSLGLMPDGMAFDAYGNLWVACLFSDRIVAVTPEGELLTLLDDGDAAATKALSDAFDRGAITHELIGATGGSIARWMTSVTFGGPDLRTVYIGSALGSRIPAFRSPVAGLAPAHWSDR